MKTLNKIFCAIITEYQWFILYAIYDIIQGDNDSIYIYR